MLVSSVAALALSVALLASFAGPPPTSAAPVSLYDQRQTGEYNTRVRFGHFILLLIPVPIEETVAPAVFDPFDFPKRNLPKKYYKPEEKVGLESGLGGSFASPAVVVPVPTVPEGKNEGTIVPSALTKLHPVVQDITSDVLVALSPSVALAKLEPLTKENPAVFGEKKTDLAKEIFVPTEEIASSVAVKKPGVKVTSPVDKFVKEIVNIEEVPVIDFIVPAAQTEVVKNKNSPHGNKIDQGSFGPAATAKETTKSDSGIISKSVGEAKDIPVHDISLEQIKKAKSISATLTIVPPQVLPGMPEAAETAEEAAFRERERILKRVTAGIEICSPDQVRDEEGNCTSIKNKRRSEALPQEGHVGLVSGLSFGLSPASE